jgi:hypothetical protein
MQLLGSSVLVWSMNSRRVNQDQVAREAYSVCHLLVMINVATMARESYMAARPTVATMPALRVPMQSYELERRGKLSSRICMYNLGKARFV